MTKMAAEGEELKKKKALLLVSHMSTLFYPMHSKFGLTFTYPTEEKEQKGEERGC